MKRMVVTMIVIWSVIAIALLGTVLYHVSFTTLNTNFPNRNFIATHSDSSDLQVYMDETFDFAQVDELMLDLSSENVEIYETEEKNIRVIHMGRNLSDQCMIQTRLNNGVLNIVRPALSYSFSFRLNSSSHVQIYLPQNYHPGMNIDLASGSIEFFDNFKFTDLSMDIASGRIKSQYELSADKVKIELTSGIITLASLQTTQYNFDVASGNIDIDALSGGGKIELTSGKISASNVDITGDIKIDIGSGFIDLQVRNDPSLIFKAEVASGSVNTYFDLIKTEKFGGDYTATVGNDPYHEFNVELASGRVNIRK